MGLQVWELHVTREGGRGWLSLFIRPWCHCMSPMLPAGHFCSSNTGRRAIKPSLKVGELGYDQRNWLRKVRWGDKEMNFRIY